MEIGKKWIGVDFDGTMAFSPGGVPHEPGKVGAPIPRMIDRIKAKLAEGVEVRVFTARVSSLEPNPEIEVAAIEAFCLEHIGQKLRVTAEKDYQMAEFWDDRGRQVVRNTGEIVGEDTSSSLQERTI